MAFAKRDAVTEGYREAVAAAQQAGFGAVLRLAGGRAAVFHEDTLEVAHAAPDPDPRAGIQERFETEAALVRRALAGLGVDARVGEVEGEYCPGRWSINAGGRRKLAGIGQRVVAGGSHTGTVLVVDGAARVRAVLEPVYAALGLDWDPGHRGRGGRRASRGQLGAGARRAAGGVRPQLRARVRRARRATRWRWPASWPRITGLTRR